MKKYRLKIPEMIRKEDAAVAAEFAEVKSLLAIDKNNLGRYDGVPADWLEEINQCCNCGIELDPTNASWHWTLNNEGKICSKCHKKIKDEPMSATEALEKNHPVLPDYKQTHINRAFEDGYLSGFPDGAAENEKKHREDIEDAERLRWLINQGVAWRDCYYGDWKEGEWAYEKLNARKEIDRAMKAHNLPEEN